MYNMRREGQPKARFTCPYTAGLFIGGFGCSTCEFAFARKSGFAPLNTSRIGWLCGPCRDPPAFNAAKGFAEFGWRKRLDHHPPVMVWRAGRGRHGLGAGFGMDRAMSDAHAQQSFDEP